MRILFLVLALVLSLPASAADAKEELQALHATLNALNQEQQGIFVQFQMLQELRKANDRATLAAQLGMPRYTAEVPNYSDLVQAQRLAAARGEILADQSDALYAHSDEIRRQRALVSQRIQDLSLRR